jgi:hypothetical protein
MEKLNLGKWVAGILISATLSLPGAAAESEATPAAPPTDPYLQCIWDLAADPQFSDIASKLPLRDMSAISFSMLADETRPNPKERKEIGDWFDRRDECIKSGEALHRAQWPPELFQLANEGAAGVKAIGVDLYNKKITFGEANKQIQLLGDSIKAKMIPIVKQYQAEIAAQKAATELQARQGQEAATRQVAEEQANANAQSAQEQALKQQRAQLFLNYMRAVRPPPLQVPQMQPMPKSYYSNCTTSGQNTNCVTH